MSKAKCNSSPYMEKYLTPNLPRDKTSMREQNVLYFGGWRLVTFMSINSQSYASIFDWSNYYLSTSCLIGEDLTPMPHSLFLHFSLIIVFIFLVFPVILSTIILMKLNLFFLFSEVLFSWRPIVWACQASWLFVQLCSFSPCF